MEILLDGLTILGVLGLLGCIVFLMRRCDALYKENEAMKENIDELVEQAIDDDLEEVILLMVDELKKIQARRKARTDPFAYQEKNKERWSDYAIERKNDVEEGGEEGTAKKRTDSRSGRNDVRADARNEGEEISRVRLPETGESVCAIDAHGEKGEDLCRASAEGSSSKGKGCTTQSEDADAAAESGRKERSFLS